MFLQALLLPDLLCPFPHDAEDGSGYQSAKALQAFWLQPRVSQLPLGTLGIPHSSVLRSGQDGCDCLSIEGLPGSGWAQGSLD